MSEIVCTCGRPTGGAWLCDRCCGTFAICIANVSVYYDDTSEIVAPKRSRFVTTGASKGSIGKSQPLPVDLRFLATRPHLTPEGISASESVGTQARWDTWNTVVAWCRTIMEEQPELHGPACLSCIHISCTAIRRRRWPRNTVRSMCAYFDRQFRWIIREQWAPDMLDELLDIERRLARLIDRPVDRWYAGKCSAADENGSCPTGLYADTDRGTVTCRTCDTTHDVAKRRDFLLSEAKDYLVTATEAAGALLAWTDYDGSETKLVDRIRKWRDRDKLDVADVTSLFGRDRHLYRLGDIQALMIVDAQAAQRDRVDGLV
jgi:hypothetical protein